MSARASEKALPALEMLLWVYPAATGMDGCPKALTWRARPLNLKPQTLTHLLRLPGPHRKRWRRECSGGAPVHKPPRLPPLDGQICPGAGLLLSPACKGGAEGVGARAVRKGPTPHVVRRAGGPPAVETCTQGTCGGGQGASYLGGVDVDRAGVTWEGDDTLSGPSRRGLADC